MLPWNSNMLAELFTRACDKGPEVWVDIRTFTFSNVIREEHVGTTSDEAEN